ncbi:MAG: hypothetical protein ACRD5G_02130 [Candidatus Acidiferrales bacterium]
MSLTGFVTDTSCGHKGANAQHAEHARRTVASGVAQYALYDEATKRLYILEPQATAAQYVGQRVKVTGALGTTPLTRAGQSLAPDAVAAYLDRDPPAASSTASGQANGLRATGATASGNTQGAASSAPTAAHSTEPKVQSHENALDQTTPIAGTLTISSIAADPTPLSRRVVKKQ